MTQIAQHTFAAIAALIITATTFVEIAHVPVDVSAVDEQFPSLNA